MAWQAGAPNEWQTHQIWTIELATGIRQNLGSGRSPLFVTNDELVIFEAAGNQRMRITITAGQRQPANDVGKLPDFDRMTTPEGHVLRRTRIDGYPFLRSAYVVHEATTGHPLLEFEAYQAAAAGPGKLVVATPPTAGTTNIFIVDIATGAATFVATSRHRPPNWPLAANARYVMWTDNYCGFPDRGKTRLSDRQTGKLTELDATLWATFTPGGLIASGEFGARALIDPETLIYVAVIPDRDSGAPAGSSGDVSWSPDYRYASHGFSGGHGGLC